MRLQKGSSHPGAQTTHPTSIFCDQKSQHSWVWRVEKGHACTDVFVCVCGCPCGWVSLVGNPSVLQITLNHFEASIAHGFMFYGQTKYLYSKLLRSDQYQTYHLNPLMALDCQSPDILWPHISCPIKPTLAFDLLLLAQVPHGRWKAWPWESGLQWCESFRHVLALLVRIAT